MVVIGPISHAQFMGEGFRKGSDALRLEFNHFFAQIKSDGTYADLVRKYYPSAFYYYPDFFAQ